jgi:hypothetical protein
LDACNLEFAREMVAAFGEDRLYHAMLRWGRQDELKSLYLALGGEDKEWPEKCRKLRLHMVGEGITELGIAKKNLQRETLCRTACTLAKHHKEYALKRPEMPPSIHARMVLDSGNKWTEKYVEVLEEFE